MAGLSSITRTRWWLIPVPPSVAMFWKLPTLSRIRLLPLTRRRRELQGELQGELRPAARAITVRAQGSAELTSSERPTVKTKAMTGLASRKPEVEYACQVLLCNTDAVIDHLDSH